MGKQRRILGYRLSRHAVKGGSGNFPICQGLIQVRFIDNAAPGTLIRTAVFFMRLKVSLQKRSRFPSAGQCREIISDVSITSSMETAFT